VVISRDPTGGPALAAGLLELSTAN
jgi:hypothetical protein